MKIGVVCEGSSDFLAFRAVFLKLAAKHGKTIDAFDPLQPTVDATSSKQTSDGGWTIVKVWLEDNGGPDLTRTLRSRLFSSSTSYDFLLVHLDGDVVWLSKDFDASTRAECFQNSTNIVNAVESYIEGLLSPPHDLDDNVIYAVPVMQTECWLAAACVERPLRRNIEHLKLKKPGKRLIRMKFGSDHLEASRAAAERLGEKLDQLRQNYSSLDHFANRAEASFA